MFNFILLMVVLHFVSDFVLQTHWQAINKNRYWDALLMHTFMYSICVTIGLSAYIMLNYGFQNIAQQLTTFFAITLISHTVIDYISSREAKKFFDRSDYHNGFVVIGLDQMIHYLQLFLTVKYLFT